MGARRAIRWTGNLILFAMVLTLGWQMGRFSWHLVWHQPPLPALSQTEGQSGGHDEPPISLGQLDLFGTPPDNEPVSQAISQSAPKTNLQLVLEGVLVAAQPEDSGAIVSGNQGEAKYYKVGDTLPGQAKLVAVESHRILLKRNGKVEALPFAQDDETAIASNNSGGINTNASPGEIFRQASSELARNPQGALSSAGLQPVQPGTASGYVYNGSNPMLSALNLKKGDVILSINGHELGNIQQDRQLMAQWYQSGQLQIEVERNGAQFTINVPVPH